ncbi:hypothetical protein Tsubulata_000077 [Turnera subulata]|uniref:Cytochrome P450 n=1 Tax=Turnera subulata TaxID=218843 RepID=A0A9Q0FLF8_9ROSI|nr:hypothetical protein Tsubulata_000077 [Turnera subulata]
MEGILVLQTFWSLAIVGMCSLVLVIQVCAAIWIKPRRIRSMLSKQGIPGPRPSSFLHGNILEMQEIQSMAVKKAQSQPQNQPISHDWAHYMFPHLLQWSQQFGPLYMYSTGNKQHLYVGRPDLIKELNHQKSLDLGRPTYLVKATEPMLGDGILKANGLYWAHQRNVIAPEFFIHRVKHMLGIMEECTIPMIREWDSLVAIGGGVADITIDEDLRTLSADIISKACFGSSYSQGKQIFAKLDALRESIFTTSLFHGLPNIRFLPTRRNRQMWRLKEEVRTLILEVVKGRQENNQSFGISDQNDLLQAILESADDSEAFQTTRDKDRFIVDNCKNIYFAGSETTSATASWGLMLLALHPEWQERVRAEIVEICGDQLHRNLLDLDKLRQLRTLTMVLQETLRLYGPGIMLTREAFAEIRLGDLTVPKGTNMWVLVPALHRDTGNWGPDANEFKPERFTRGISEACKYPQAYIPWGIGSRRCLGETFAMLQLKVILALVLSKFSFSLSPEYHHSPVFKMVLFPKHGVRLLMRRVQSSNMGTKREAY